MGAHTLGKKHFNDTSVRAKTTPSATATYIGHSGNSDNGSEQVQYIEPATLESGCGGGASRAGSASTLLYAMPMEVDGEAGGSTLNNMTLLRSRSGTVVAAATSGNYEIVSTIDGIDGICAPANEQRYNVAARGGACTAEYAEVGNQYASKPMMQHGRNLYNTFVERGGAGHVGGAGARKANQEYRELHGASPPTHSAITIVSAYGDANSDSSNDDLDV